MNSIFRGIFFVLITLSISFTATSQNLNLEEKTINQSLILGEGFDIRKLNPGNWSAPTLTKNQRQAIVTIQVNNQSISNLSKKNIEPKGEIYYVESAYDFERKVLATDTLSNFYLSENSAFFNQRILDGNNKPVFVYAIYKKPIQTYRIPSVKASNLDTLFTDYVKRLGKDISAAGFVHLFGTHYATEVTVGGAFTLRLTVDRDEFIYSPYTKEEFKTEMEKFITSKNEETSYINEFLKVKSVDVFANGGDKEVRSLQKWLPTLPSKAQPIDVKLEPITNLLTTQNFPNIEDLESKKELLDAFIEKGIATVKERIKQPVKSTYFQKFSIPFRQRLVNILKVESGKNTDNDSPFTGDIFFGGFTDNQTVIKSTSVIDYGGVRLETLITDEEIEVNKFIDVIVPPEHFKKGFVNVWDESRKLVKGMGRTALVISGDPENRTYFQEALRKKITKKAEVKSIDNDSYILHYTLESIRLENEIFKQNTTMDYVMDSQIITAASVGDLRLIKELYAKGANVRAEGVLRAAIVSTQPAEVINVLIDQGIVPTTADLDMIFEVNYFNPDIAIILLERGAKPKNNMIFKAVAYRQPNVIKALLREGAIPVNNDLEFAIRLKDEELVSAITGRKVLKIEDEQIVYDEAPLPKATMEETVYVVKRGDYLSKIANFYGVNVSDIKTWNNLKNDLIFINQKLLILDVNSITSTVTEISKSQTLVEKEISTKPIVEVIEVQNNMVAKKEVFSLETSQNRFTYKVKNGDILGKIAQKFNVSVNEIKKWNNLKNSRLYINQELIIQTINKEPIKNPEISQIGDTSLSVIENRKKEEEIAVVKEEKIISKKEIKNAPEVKLPIAADQATTEYALENALEDNKEAEALELVNKLNKADNRFLTIASRRGQINVVKALLKKGASPDAGIINAIFYREIGVLEELIKSGAELTLQQLNLTIKTDFLEAFKLYIENEVNPLESYIGETAVHQIVQTYSEERFEMLQFLIDKGFAIDNKNEKGETPLHKAVRMGDSNLPIVKLLIENNANTKDKDNTGKSILEVNTGQELKKVLNKAK